MAGRVVTSREFVYTDWTKTDLLFAILLNLGSKVNYLTKDFVLVHKICDLGW